MWPAYAFKQVEEVLSTLLLYLFGIKRDMRGHVDFAMRGSSKVVVWLKLPSWSADR